MILYRAYHLMMLVPFSKHIVKGDKHEYGRGTTHTFLDGCLKSGGHRPRLRNQPVTA